MRGKIGIVVGLAAGYVLGARAGRERYEQKQVDKAKELGKSAALAVPTALWDGAVKVTKAATKSGTPGQKLDATIDAAKKAVDD